MQKTIWIILLISLFACQDKGTKEETTETQTESAEQAKGIAIITNEDGQSISFVDIASQEVKKELKVGKRPRGVKVIKELNKAYVAVSGSPKCPPWIDEEECAAKGVDKSADGIAEIDLVNMELTQILPSGSDPEQFDVSKDGKYLFIANEDAGKLSVVSIDQKQIITEVEVSEEPEGVRVSPDGKWVAVSCEEKGEVAMIKTDNYELIAMIKVGNRPRDLVFTSDSQTLFVSCEASSYISRVDVSSMEVKSEIKLGGPMLPVGIVLSEDEKSLYVAGGRGKSVVAIDIESETVINTVEVLERPWGLDKDLTATMLISANGGSNDISFIDIQEFKIIKNLAVGEGPWGVCVY